MQVGRGRSLAGRKGRSTSGRPLILGHRGAPAEFPENTLASFRRALELGADGMELDVQRSADGIPVVIHDPTLERTTNRQGRVDALPWAALQQWVPSLEQVADWAGETGAWLNVELKTAGVEAASLAVLEQVLKHTLVSSFLPEVVREVRRLEPKAPSYLLSERWDAEALATVWETKASGVCLHDDAATPAALQELATADLPVVVWTVDDPLRIRTLLQSGVAAIITNHPEHAVAERAALNL